MDEMQIWNLVFNALGVILFGALLLALRPIRRSLDSVVDSIEEIVGQLKVAVPPTIIIEHSKETETEGPGG